MGLRNAAIVVANCLRHLPTYYLCFLQIGGSLANPNKTAAMRKSDWLW